MSKLSELPAGQIPEMVLLHQEDSHYNLIIPRTSKLALDGGLDFQRQEQKKKIDEKNQERSKPVEVNVKLLEERIQQLENKCKNLEYEKNSLVQKLKDLENSDVDEKDKEETDAKVLLNNKNAGFQRPNPQTAPVNKTRVK